MSGDKFLLDTIASLYILNGEETTAWWKDAAVVKDFDNRCNNWKAGKEKAYSTKETASYIQQLKKDLSN